MSLVVLDGGVGMAVGVGVGVPPLFHGHVGVHVVVGGGGVVEIGVGSVLVVILENSYD